MPKKKPIKRSSARDSKVSTEENLSVSKQTAGSVTGAVVGGMMAGPVGAVAGSVAGAMVGEASAKGKQRVKKAVEMIQRGISSGTAGKALQSVTGRIKSVAATSRRKSAAKASPNKPATKKKAKSKAARGAMKSTAKASKASATKKTRQEEDQIGRLLGKANRKRCGVPDIRVLLQSARMLRIVGGVRDWHRASHSAYPILQPIGLSDFQKRVRRRVAANRSQFYLDVASGRFTVTTGQARKHPKV